MTGPPAQVEVYVGDGVQEFLEIDRILDHTFVEPADLADEAYLEPDTNVVFVRTGETWFAIRLVLLNDPATNNDRLEALARAVAERI